MHRAEPAAKSLVVECIRNGWLDVDVDTAEVVTTFRRRVVRSVHIDRDGYAGFTLNVERKDKRGKPTIQRTASGKIVKRYRRRQYVMVHRLVLAKKMMVEKHGDNWRAKFFELPLSLDVDHVDTNPGNNAGGNLRLRFPCVNRGWVTLTPEQQAKADADAAEFMGAAR